MASTSNRVQSLLSRTRDLTRPTLVETPQFTQDHTQDLQSSPQSDEKLPETSYVFYSEPPIDQIPERVIPKNSLPPRTDSKSPASPRIPKPPKGAKSIDKSSVQDELDASIDELRTSQTQMFEKVVTGLRKERQLLDRMGGRLKSIKPPPQSGQEDKYKKKLAKLYGIVQQEAKIMDDRYSQLQEENRQLNKLLAKARTSSNHSSNQASSSALFIVTKLSKQAPETPFPFDFQMPESGSADYRSEVEAKAREFVSSLPDSVEELKSLTATLANRLLNEQSLRLNAEEKATHLISKEEGVVGQLESQVKILERKLVAI
mmetsp:Transcript_11899/g.22837  ORF Transcript_11899/g.22837 Transcript_11899/m.22837 type:complete len:317 (+) Transcript_11899:74-1024(+)